MTTNGRCLSSNSKKDYGIQGVILSGDITSITATWGAKLQVNVDSWTIVKIAEKNRGIVATRNLPEGTINAMYGGVVFDRKENKHAVTSHSLDMKDSGKMLAIVGYKCNMLPKFAQASLAKEPDVHSWPNSHVDWMIPYRSYSNALFRIW
jgi:membrane carboxypeptidase/penicillin-binding protein